MRLRNVKNAKERIEKSEFVIHNPVEYKHHFQKLFLNSNPIHIEIGTGKGQFLYEMARKYSTINFIGIEKYESILIRAIEKVEKNPLPNLKFICMDAKNIDTVFEKEISCIYLNFSDPWPKKRHANRRLTSPIFLNLYENLFAREKRIIQKTDNPILFESSLLHFSQFGYTFLELSFDLEHTTIENIETEYEQKFKQKGMNIYYVNVYKK